jgi:hypothetical protein
VFSHWVIQIKPILRRTPWLQAGNKLPVFEVRTRPVTLEVGLRVLEMSLVVLQRGLRLIELRLVSARIYLREQIALLDRLTLAERIIEFVEQDGHCRELWRSVAREHQRSQRQGDPQASLAR